jgi:hypothetical protein
MIEGSHRSSTDPKLRSLLQKAVRRGFSGLVRQVAYRLSESGGSSWLRSRAGVIAFEEAWPTAATAFSDIPSDPLKALLEVSKAVKQKDAAGLGSLAFAYHEGDTSSLHDAPDPRAIRIVAAALARPSDFFVWVYSLCHTTEQKSLASAAQKSFPLATWGWDKTCILGGAYLACTSDIPEVGSAELIEQGPFPYWVAVDKHTPQGKVAMKQVATALGIPLPQILWASFYFESAVTNSLAPSPWWEAERRWRLKQQGMTESAAQQIWNAAASKVTLAVARDAELLRRSVEEGTPTKQQTLSRF